MEHPPEKTPLSVFATYWNEKDWIEASLTQIDALNPREVIICDGCFDPRYPNHSTDGTREIIQEWVSKRPHARMISAYRASKVKGLWYICTHRLSWRNVLLRILFLFYYRKTNVYRINQAATFNFMTELSQYWKKGNWFMTLDADQFYSDATCDAIRTTCANSTEPAKLLTAEELTFFEDFSHYTKEYEKRNYNNMPHRILRGTHIVPTRDIILETFPRPRVYGKHPEIQKKAVGYYLHYKFRPYDSERSEKSYLLGDRKKPSTQAYTLETFKDSHPSVIQNTLSESL